MDGRTTYFRLVKLLEEFKKTEIRMDELRSLILMNIGSDERTITKCLKILAGTGKIKDIGNCRFKITL